MVASDLPSGLRIRDFDPLIAGRSEFRALNDFINKIRREGWPAEALTSVEESILKKRSLTSFERQRLWAAWQGSSLAGLASFLVSETDANHHVAEFLIEVEPALRRRGLAKALLRQVADAAAEEGRTLLLAWTSSLVPGAAAFMRRLGAEEAQVMSINQLELGDVNHSLIGQWLRRGDTLAGRFAIGFWDGPYPDAEIDAIVEMRAMMNTMPRDKLAVEDECWTAERLRENEAVLEKQATVRHTAFVRSLDDGTIAGFSEVFWNPSQPRVLLQGDTAVSPERRNLGIATWLKAAMIESMLRIYPGARCVRTWNGVTNHSMLRINEQMGFRTRHYATNWQLELADVQEYLARR